MTEALQNDERNKVLVHCAAGRSRSAAFTCAYMLSQEPEWQLDDAIKHG